MTYLPKSELVGVLAPYSINTRDIGKNWQDLGIITGGPAADSLSYIGGGIVIAANNTIGGIPDGHVWRSIDYGVTWSDLGIVTVGTALHRSVHIGNGIAIVTDFANNIFRSTNFGSSWTNVFVAPNFIQSIAYLGDNGVVLAVDGNTNLIRSTDFGATWVNNGPSQGAVFVTYLENGIVLIGLFANIGRSTDFGATFPTTIAVSPTFMFTCIYLGNGIVLIGDNNGHIFRSNDYGLTWSDEGVITGSAITIMLYVGDGVALLAENNGHIWRSENFGITWTDLGLKTAGGANPISFADISNGIVMFSSSLGHLHRSDVAYKRDEAEIEGCFIGVKTTKTVNTALPAGVATIIPFDIELIDTDSMHDNVINNSRFVAPFSGWYNLQVGIYATNLNLKEILKNGAPGIVQGIGGAVFPVETHFAEMINLTKGDFLELRLTSNAGGNCFLITTFGLSLIRV